MFRRLGVLALLTLLLCPSPSGAAELKPYVKVAREVNLKAPGPYTFRFSLWDSHANSATPIFSEQKEIALEGSTLTHLLGSVAPEVNPLPVMAFADQLYLTVDYLAESGKWRRLGGRELLAAVPYALYTLLPAPEGPAGPPGADGLPGPQGPAGAQGAPGVSCWDRDEDTVCDLPAEDANGDGACTVADCRGPQGGSGGIDLACEANDTLVWRAGGWICVPLPSSGCSAGEMKPCYEGNPATLNVGRCRAGVNVCSENGTWGPCEHQVLPAAVETCEPGLTGMGPALAALLDDDCDGQWNVENAPGCVLFYPDADGDGLGAFDGGRCLCGPTAAFPAAAPGDCNDEDAAVKGPVTAYLRDVDADGYGDCSVPPKKLCAPTAPYTASEAANCDCDDTVAATPSIPSSRGYSRAEKGKDADGDGFGDCTVPLGWYCPGNAYTAPELFSFTADPGYPVCDCDDTNADVIQPEPYCLDADGDGATQEGVSYVPDDASKTLCAATPPYNTRCSESTGPDCDDADPNVTGEMYCRDADGDGYRAETTNPSSCMFLCFPAAPYVLPASAPADCNDADATAFVEATWYVDADGDGFGSTTIAFQGCGNNAPRPGEAQNTADCDDSNPDPTKIKTSWCRDADGDGFRSLVCPPGASCTSPGPSYPLPRWAPLDCDDTNPAIQACP